jgi:hypothetical protein
MGAIRCTGGKVSQEAPAVWSGMGIPLIVALTATDGLMGARARGPLAVDGRDPISGSDSYKTERTFRTLERHRQQQRSLFGSSDRLLTHGRVEAREQTRPGGVGRLNLRARESRGGGGGDEQMQQGGDARVAPGEVRVVLHTSGLEGEESEVVFLDGRDEALEDEERFAQRNGRDLRRWRGKTESEGQ